MQPTVRRVFSYGAGSRSARLGSVVDYVCGLKYYGVSINKVYTKIMFTTMYMIIDAYAKIVFSLDAMQYQLPGVVTSAQ